MIETTIDTTKIIAPEDLPSREQLLSALEGLRQETGDVFTVTQKRLSEAEIKISQQVARGAKFGRYTEGEREAIDKFDMAATIPAIQVSIRKRKAPYVESTGFWGALQHAFHHRVVVFTPGVDFLDRPLTTEFTDNQQQVVEAWKAYVADRLPKK